MANVKLILREDVPNLGDAGDLVTVKPGFARNYLVPGGKAMPATEGRVKELEHHKRVVAERMARELKDLKALKSRVEALSLEVTAKAGEGGKLFGSVTTANIADLLKEKGYDIDRRKIQLPDGAIKEIGEHTVPVRLRNDLTAEVKLTVSVEE